MTLDMTSVAVFLNFFFLGGGTSFIGNGKLLQRITPAYFTDLIPYSVGCINTYSIDVTV